MGRRVKSLYSLFIGLGIKLGRRVMSLYSLFIGLGVKLGRRVRSLLSFFMRFGRIVRGDDINSSFDTSHGLPVIYHYLSICPSAVLSLWAGGPVWHSGDGSGWKEENGLYREGSSYALAIIHRLEMKLFSEL